MLGFEFSSPVLDVPAFSPRAWDPCHLSSFLRMFQSCPRQGPINPYGLIMGQGRLESLLFSRACLFLQDARAKRAGCPISLINVESLSY